jgi:hypothetical protein
MSKLPESDCRIVFPMKTSTRFLPRPAAGTRFCRIEAVRPKESGKSGYTRLRRAARVRPRAHTARRRDRRPNRGYADELCDSIVPKSQLQRKQRLDVIPPRPA